MTMRRATREVWDVFFDQLPLGLVELDPAGRVTMANAEARRLLGERDRGLVGTPFDAVVSTVGGATFRDPAAARPGAAVIVEVMRPDGEVRILEVSSSTEPTAAADRRLLALADVTEQRWLEERRAHAQRLEAVGLLATGVVHDLRNVLSVIEANATVLAASTDPAIREAARDIEEAQRWGKSLVQRLLALARHDEHQPERLDLSDVVREFVRFLDRLLGRGHRLEVTAGEPVGIVADRTQIEQVAMNLVINARDAMPDGGTIRIRVARLPGRAATELGSELAVADQAMLEVEDHGIGMTPETKARMYEPFFTTKPRGHGTGLGLRTVREVAARSGGTVAVTSTPGRGTRFRIFLPITGAAGRDRPRHG